MKDRGERAGTIGSLGRFAPSPRRVAVGFLTGSTGRLTAFVIDVWVASARYAGRRAFGKETPW